MQAPKRTLMQCAWQVVPITVYWNKPSGQKVYLPLGGGAQRRFQLGSRQMNLGLQLFKNVVRPTKGTVYDLRGLVELVF